MPQAAQADLSRRIAHTDPAAFRPSPAVHGGAGTMAFTALLNRGAVTPEFNFLHRGEIPPGAGIGHHFHNTVEEMFVILDGEAQFTIDGRTALVKGPAGVICRTGHSHAIYNSSTKPVQWVNLNVSLNAGVYDNFDLGDTRAGAHSGSHTDFHGGTLRQGSPSQAGRTRWPRRAAPAAAPTTVAHAARAWSCSFLDDMGLYRSCAGTAGNVDNRNEARLPSARRTTSLPAAVPSPSRAPHRKRRLSERVTRFRSRSENRVYSRTQVRSRLNFSSWVSRRTWPPRRNCLRGANQR